MPSPDDITAALAAARAASASAANAATETAATQTRLSEIIATIEAAAASATSAWDEAMAAVSDLGTVEYLLAQPDPDLSAIERMQAAIDQLTSDLAQMTTNRDQLQEAFDEVSSERNAALDALDLVNSSLDTCMDERDSLASQLSAALADLAACQGDPDPDPDPSLYKLVSGPWDLPPGDVVLIPEGSDPYDPPQLGEYYAAGAGANVGVTRGSAPVRTGPPTAGGGDKLHIELARGTAGTTPAHEQHFLLDPIHTITAETCWRLLDSEPHDTGKIGGFGAFDGDWDDWPGGGSKGPANWMVRGCWWHYNRVAGSARLTNLIKLGGPFARDIYEIDGQGGVGANLGAPRRYLSSDDWVAELYLDDVGDFHNLLGEWITVRHVASTEGDPTAPQGWMDTYVAVAGGSYQLVQALGGIQWAQSLRVDNHGEGFNRGYLSAMHYRRDAAISSIVQLLSANYWAGAVRP